MSKRKCKEENFEPLKFLVATIVRRIQERRERLVTKSERGAQKHGEQ